MRFDIAMRTPTVEEIETIEQVSSALAKAARAVLDTMVEVACQFAEATSELAERTEISEEQLLELIRQLEGLDDEAACILDENRKKLRPPKKIQYPAYHYDPPRTKYLAYNLRNYQ